MKNIVVSMDLGGTNMRFAAVRPDGVILASLRRSTPAADINDVSGAIVEGFRRVLAKAGINRPLCLSAAVPTTSSSGSGILSRLPNLPVLDHFDLGGLLQSEFQVPVLITNDATSATVGEHWLGAARFTENVIGVTLGTGIGGGLIIEGRPFKGADGSAGEVGHICVEPNGYPCGCGSIGCLEQYASGTAILRSAKLARLKVNTPKDVFLKARSGDSRAIAVFNEAGRALGIAFAGLINVFNPDKIVIGGGVASAWPLIKLSAINEIKDRAFAIPVERVTIVRAKLGERAGVLGAARLAFLQVANTER